MSELAQVLTRLDMLERNQRADISAIYAEMKEDRAAMDAKRESDRAIFMQEIKNIFTHGCAMAATHNANAVILKTQVEDMQRIRAVFDKGMGAVWAVGALVSLIGLVAGWLGSLLQAVKGHP